MALKMPFQEFVSKTVILTLVLALFGCATATPYQPEIFGQRVSGGYSETRLGGDRYRVHFSGNYFTARDTVEGYLLYRAAELTLQDGKDWFEMVDHTTERDRRTYVERRPHYRPWYGSGYGYWRPHWRYYRGSRWTRWHPYGRDPFWYDDVDVQTVERFEADAEIVMHEYPMSTQVDRAFDARKVIADLGLTIKRPEDS